MDTEYLFDEGSIPSLVELTNYHVLKSITNQLVSNPPALNLIGGIIAMK
jgi:hypothetical protein